MPIEHIDQRGIILLSDERIISNSLIELGLAQIARAVVEVTIDPKERPISAPLAVIDITSATKYLIRGRILENEINNHDEQAGPFSEVRLNELLRGSKRLAFDNLPEQLERVTGYALKNRQLYYEFGRVRQQMICSSIAPERLIECALRFSYEVIEPMIIEFWDDLIIMHAPEYEVDPEGRVQFYLDKYKINLTKRHEEE